VCDAGFGGIDCSRQLLASGESPCPLGCSGRGLCGPSGECVCEPGFGGPACARAAATARVEATGTGAPRAPSRSTARMAPPHAPCPANCSAHGRCHRGACACHEGFRGRACEVAVALCSRLSNCSGHGSCDVGLGRCVCHPGFSGPDCSLALATACPLGCSTHGTCSSRTLSLPQPLAAGDVAAASATAECECRDGLAPPACAYTTGSRLARIASAVFTLSSPGASSGRGGTACPLGCSGRGHCRESTCSCVAGFTGPGCEHATPRCPADCNGHGSCVLGLCECEPGWSGAECGQAAYQCEGGCGGHGTCVGVSVDATTPKAQRARALAVGPEGALAVGPEGAPSASLDAVGGASTIEALPREGVCACSAGYAGARCERFALKPPDCLHNCSGRGTCSLGGVCVCAPGYTGAGCETADSDHGSCPRGCCGHGACRYRGGRPPPGLSHSAALALGYSGGLASRHCVCDALWTGEDCCTPRLHEHCPHDCSGNGECVNGVCACARGWGGLGCDALETGTCPHDCSGHGECREDGTCRCESGFAGAGCEHGSAW
jgi:tenascin